GLKVIKNRDAHQNRRQNEVLFTEKPAWPRPTRHGSWHRIGSRTSGGYDAADSPKRLAGRAHADRWVGARVGAPVGIVSRRRAAVRAIWLAGLAGLAGLVMGASSGEENVDSCFSMGRGRR